MRKSLPLALALAASVLPLATVDAWAEANLTPDTTLRLPRPPGSGLSEQSKTFIDQALGAASAAVAAGQLAAKQAQSTEIRTLAGQIATDQDTVQSDLVRLSKAKDHEPHGAGTLPAELNSLIRLARDSEAGADFDQRYLAAQYQASRWLVGLYQTEMAQTQDLQLRTFAMERELTLRKQLEAIQRTAGGIGLQLEAPKSAPQY